MRGKIDTLMKLITGKNEKKPYRCPICDGVGKIIGQIIIKVDCGTCEGKGIVWG
jgi:DnaJ-class molecular chaperone